MNKQRWDRLLSEIKESGVEGLVMVPGPNFFYMTGLRMGLSERSTACVISASGQVSFIMPKLEAKKGDAVASRLEDAGVVLPFSIVSYSDEEGPRNAYKNAFSASQNTSAEKWAVEFRNMRVLEYELMREALGEISLVDAGDIFKKLRIIKDEDELRSTEEACRLCDLGADIARNLLVEGVNAVDVAREIEQRLKSKGAMAVGMSLATGPDTALPHAHTSDRKVEDGDLAWLDLVVCVDGYWGDITRTYVIGTPSDEMKTVYKVVLKAQEHARLNAKPGMTGAEIDALARDVIRSFGYGDRFIHRTGHGLGLEVHEEPYIVASNHVPLEVGATFTIEPGIYIPGKGGVRIEDDVILTENGLRSLTSYPRNLLDDETKLVV